MYKPLFAENPCFPQSDRKAEEGPDKPLLERAGQDGTHGPGEAGNVRGRANRARRWGSSAATLGRDAGSLETERPLQRPLLPGGRALGEPQAALARIRPSACSLPGIKPCTQPARVGLRPLGRCEELFLLLQSSGKLEKAEILEMTVQYLRALHSADFPRGREKELLAEFANYFHYGYHECMKNLVHYLTTVERMETKDTKYARILAFLQSKARLGAEPAFQPLGSLPEPDFSYQLHPAGAELTGHSPGEASVFPQGAAPGPFPWPHGAARSPALPYLPGAPVALPSPAQQHSPFLTPVQGLDRHYLNLIGHAHPNALNLHPPQHPPVL
ncbi:hairy and enhancer of split-related protein HELT [Acinonyx jubatus]|uniref:Hairy and enhancer of split-related protein HELT n=1 Tax=Acinonyx jubatus TaxID=32536 RepID=A0ABM3PKQ0_ACIJB|nr:hairy and enhancer of split-related protein HELT [Acinonyx jubatus]